ncbi:MAG TPA: hypothetical protein VGM45_08770 [Gaiellaceae bacterium]|jgi:hypothetical protein
MAHKDEGFTVDLRGYRSPRHRAREYAIADPYETNSSPLDHWIMATAGCASRFVSNADDCKRETWAEHVRGCAECAKTERWAAVLAFAASRRASRVAAA